MTNILPRDRAELIIAEHAAGKTVPQIAAEYGHSPQTVRSYALGHRAPGEFTAREDSFAPFAAYCRRRLEDDPHLRAMPLLAEITGLGFPGTGKTFYRALERHEISPHPCPDCHVARISGYALRPPEQMPRPFRLAVPLSPVGGETMASFLRRLADANRTTLDALLGIVHPWFSIKNQWHDDRWQHDKLAPWAGEAAESLAAACGSTALALKKALPASGGNREQPARAVTACRLCSAAQRIQQPVPAHLPACRRVCLRHGIWLSAHGTPQFSVRDCPDILDAERAGHAGCSAAAPPNSSSTSPRSPPAKPVNDPGSAGQRRSSRRTQDPPPNPAHRKCSWPRRTRTPSPSRKPASKPPVSNLHWQELHPLTARNRQNGRQAGCSLPA